MDVSDKYGQMLIDHHRVTEVKEEKAARETKEEKAVVKTKSPAKRKTRK